MHRITLTLLILVGWFLPYNFIFANSSHYFGGAPLTPPAFRSQSSAVTSGTSITINKPIGTLDGDVMVAEILSVKGSIGPLATITPPSGWILQQSGTECTGSNCYRFSVYIKVASGEGTSYIWGAADAWNMAGGIASYSGADTTNPVDVSSINTTSTGATTQTATTIMTTAPNTTIVGAYTKGYWDATWTPPPGMTERIDKLIGGDWGSISLDDVSQATAGATGDKTATASVSQTGTGILLALRGVIVSTPLWVQNVPDGGSFADPVGGNTWNLDSSNGYLFTAVVADHEYVYTGRAWYGPWSGSGGGTIQRWNANTGELLASASTCACYGVYSMELKDDGTGNVRLYVYKVNGTEIFDRLTLASVGGNSTVVVPASPSDPAVAQKRIANRNDGVSMEVQHYFGSIGTFNSPGSGQNGQQNILGLYQNNLNWGSTPQYNDPSWVTTVVPAPTYVGHSYFGAENIALSPAGDYMYVAGGNKSGGVYSSRLEKIDLDMPPNPDAAISPTPVQVVSGGTVTLSWASHYADYCDISSTGAWGWVNLPANGYKYNVGPITADTTFTVTCTRISDGMTATAGALVALARPTAIITSPSGDIAVGPTDTVNFDGTTSHDASMGNVSAYEWRDGNCTTGALLSSSGTFNQTFSIGSHSVYLRVQDSGGLWSTNCPSRTITVPPQCSDGKDNDGDTLTDAADPGCWTDPTNSATYDPNRNSENNCGNGICEQTYGETTKTCRLDCRVIFREN